MPTSSAVAAASVALVVARVVVLGRARLEGHRAGRDRADDVGRVVDLRLDGHGARRRARVDALTLGRVRELDEVDAGPDRAYDLGAHERDGGADRRQHLGVARQQRTGGRARRATSGTSAAPAPPSATSGTSRRKLVLLRGLGHDGGDLRAATSRSARAASSAVAAQSLGRAARRRRGPPRGARRGTHRAAASPSAFAAHVAVSANRPPAASTHA